MWTRLTSSILIILSALTLNGQSTDAIALANEYFFQGDNEKAEEEYRKILRNKRNIPAVHDNYVKLLMREKKYEQAEKHIKRASKEYPQNFTYAIDLGLVYAALGEELKAIATYEEIIEKVTTEAANESNSNKIRILAQTFYEKNLRNYTLEVYSKGREKLLRPEMFA